MFKMIPKAAFALACLAIASQFIQADTPDVLPIPSASDCCGDACECCEACPCDTKPAVSSARDTSEPKIGDRQTFDGVEKELYLVRIENGRRFLHYRPVASVVRSGTAVARSGGNFRSHWTYPGAIDNHLTRDHGVSVNGMTQEEMLSLHDSLHESGRPVMRSQPAVSNCPGGVCPVPQQRTFLFRR